MSTYRLSGINLTVLLQCCISVDCTVAWYVFSVIAECPVIYVVSVFDVKVCKVYL